MVHPNWQCFDSLLSKQRTLLPVNSVASERVAAVAAVSRLDVFPMTPERLLAVCLS